MKVISYPEMLDSVKGLVQAGSEFKGSVFRSTLKNEQVSDRTVKSYLSTVMNFITKWADYAEEIEDALDDTDKPEEGKAIYITYDNAHDYIYANYDYASVLPFADGVLQGVDSGKFEDEDDISDFFDHTTSKAFKDRKETVAGLLSDISDMDLDSRKDVNNVKERSYFSSVKRQHMFDRRDSKELYKAIEKVCQYLQDRLNKDLDFGTVQPKLLISVINYTVEYMTYSLVAYGTRVFIIGTYCNQFIADDFKLTESVQQQDSLETGYMQMADDNGFRDVSNVEKISTFMCEWLKQVGVPDKENHHACSNSWVAGEDNVLFMNTIGNPLREYIMSPKFNDCVSYDLRYFEDMRDMLKKLTHNSLQAIQGTSTAKQEMLTYIKTLKPDKETVESYISFAKDLVEYVVMLLNKISRVYLNIQKWSIEEHNHPVSNNSAIRISTEVSTMIAELYRELSTALLTRARDIEMTIAHIKNESINKRMEELKIRVPGEKKDDLSSNDNTMMGVPDTIRTPVDLSPYYALPTMESLEMYDEYVRSLPGMAGDPYYEAANISSLLNAIKSLLDGAIKKVGDFFTNKQFNSAVNWCRKHQAQMMDMTFVGPMEVLPYTAKSSITHLDKTIAAIKDGLTPEVVKSKDNLDRFINSLYDGGNTKIISLFNNESIKPAEQTRRYNNWVFFGKDPTDGTNIPMKKLNSSEEIKRELQTVWLVNVLGANDTHESLKQKAKEFDAAFSSMKARVVSITGTGSSDASPNLSNGNGKDSSTTVGNKSSNKVNQNNGAFSDADLLNQALTRTQLAVKQLWGSLHDGIIESIKNMYHYIQESYSNAKK